MTQEGFVVLPEGELRWEDIPGGLGAKMAVVSGRPEVDGELYVIRCRFPAFVMDLPHCHPRARHITVLEGTWRAGTGRVFAPASTAARSLAPGDTMLHPAGAWHWDGSWDGKPVTVQIVGLGPASTTLCDPSRAMWVDVRAQRAKL
jgi:hypothetical protein